MKFSVSAAVAIAALANVASAHCELHPSWPLHEKKTPQEHYTDCSRTLDRFAWLTANGVKGAEYANIRKNTNYNSPIDTSIGTNADMRCNAGGASGSATTTVTVAAGSSVTFTLDTPVYHQGPVTVYLGKAPSTAAAWDGSGANWFSIQRNGPTFSGGQATWPMAGTYSVAIPSQVPTGEYLLRIEQIGLHNPGGAPQFYLSCAQIKVTNGGSGSPKPMVSIPGHITATDPGITVNIYNAVSLNSIEPR